MPLISDLTCQRTLEPRGRSFPLSASKVSPSCLSFSPVSFRVSFASYCNVGFQTQDFKFFRFFIRFCTIFYSFYRSRLKDLNLDGKKNSRSLMCHSARICCCSCYLSPFFSFDRFCGFCHRIVWLLFLVRSRLFVVY